MTAAPLLLGAAWGLAVLAALLPRGPRPVPSLGAAAPAGRVHPLSALGRVLRRRAGRPPDPARDTATGVALVASAVLAVLAPALAVLPWPVALALPPLRARRRALRQAERAADAVPDTVDLLALALGSGLAVAGALRLVAPRAPPPLGAALVAAVVRFDHGEALEAALARVVERCPPARPLVAVLVAAHCDGVAAADPLARLADELRAERRRRAEARARQVPVRLLFPLVGCTLPAFVLVTVVPAVMSALGGIDPP